MLLSYTKDLLQFAVDYCEVSLEAITRLSFAFSSLGQSGNVIIDSIAEKLNVSFANNQDRSVNLCGETLLNFTKIVSLTLFDPSDIVDLPNSEINIHVKTLFRENVSHSLCSGLIPPARHFNFSHTHHL